MLTNKKVITDVETTGLDSSLNGIHQISGIILIDDEQVDEFDFYVRPFEEDLIETTALQAGNVTYDQIMSYEDPKQVHKQLNKILGKHVNKFNRNDKYLFYAYNSPFDNQHWRSFYKKCDDEYFGSWFFTPDICVMRFVAEFFQDIRHKIDNFKQETIAKFLGLVTEEDESNFHNSMFDVEITKKIYYEIKKRVRIDE